MAWLLHDWPIRFEASEMTHDKKRAEDPGAGHVLVINAQVLVGVGDIFEVHRAPLGSSATAAW